MCTDKELKNIIASGALTQSIDKEISENNKAVKKIMKDTERELRRILF